MRLCLPRASRPAVATHQPRSTLCRMASSSPAVPPRFTIEVVSDNACPWCFVGKRRLEQAIKKLDAPVSVRWSPFFLNAGVPAEGWDLQEHLTEKYGPARAAMFALSNPTNPLVAAGKTVGINFVTWRVVNTLDSHRLVEYAEQQFGEVKQNEMIEAIFRSLFEEGKNIADIDVLVSLGAKCGLDTEKVRTYLRSEEHKAEVFREGSKWTGRVSGVPFFIIGAPGTRQKVALSGAQDVETFMDAFEHLTGLLRNKA